jgi:hypothetical protein
MKTNTKNEITDYHKVVEFVASKLDTWTSSDIRLCADAKGYPPLDNPSQWGNVVRSAQAAGICRPLDKFTKSHYKGTNASPRLLWTAARRPKL